MKSAETNGADLAWRAFCYVAGEMTEQESARFEERLARDQVARVAVAQAVLLGEAVVLSSRGRVAVIASPVRRKTAFSKIFVLAAAAAVLFGVGMALWFGAATPYGPPEFATSRSGAPGTPVDDSPNWRAGRMLALWSASAVEFERSDERWIDENGAIRHTEGRHFQEAAGNLSAADAWGAADDVEFDVPGWLLAAVSADAAVSPDGDDQPESEPALEEN